MNLAAFVVCVAQGHIWRESRWPGWQTCRRCAMRRPDTAGTPDAAPPPAPALRRPARSVPTLALATRKGGAGKTTLALQLALAAHLRGRKTVLVDADPQLSASAALRDRPAGDAPRLLDTTALSLTQVRALAEKDADLLVIDTPGGQGRALTEALSLADLALLVARPTFLDIAAAVRTHAEAKAIGTPALIVLNQAPPTRGGAEPASVASVIEALRTNGIPVAPTVLRARTAFQTSVASGRSVEELGASPAAAEVAALWDVVDAILAETRRPRDADTDRRDPPRRPTAKEIHASADA